MPNPVDWRALPPRERARHPDTPPRKLLALAKKYPAEVLANPALPLIALEAPALAVDFHFLRCVHHGERNG
jgi:hypothetical protein